jgi:ubiquinone/menaquinone biosynthesis C-methylase UbiE
MLERAGATVLTAAVNSGAPFGSFVASRGLVALHVTAAHRLPLFDGTMDIVHAGHDLGGGGWMVPGVMLEFALYDVYRVLRPGGLFWLDHFVCAAAQLNATFAPMIDRVGFRKLRWNTGRGKEKGRWYVSALLEKPMA